MILKAQGVSEKPHRTTSVGVNYQGHTGPSYQHSVSYEDTICHHTWFSSVKWTNSRTNQGSGEQNGEDAEGELCAYPPDTPWAAGIVPDSATAF